METGRDFDRSVAIWDIGQVWNFFTEVKKKELLFLAVPVFFALYDVRLGFF